MQKLPVAKRIRGHSERVGDASSRCCWGDLARRAAWVIGVGGAMLFVLSWMWPGLDGRASRPTEVINFIAFGTRAFVLYIGLGVTAFLIVALLLRQWLLCMLILVPVATFCLLPELMWAVRDQPHWMPNGQSGLQATARPDLIVYSHNAHQGRLDHVLLRDSVLKHDADIVVIQEVSDDYFELLKVALEPSHSHWAHLGQDWLNGHAVFSRFPIVGEQRSMAFADPPPVPHPNRMRDGDMQQRLVVTVAGHDLVIQNLHLISPMNPTLVAEQSRQYTGMIASLRDDGLLSGTAPPLLLIGDFNATPRSRAQARLRALGLREAHAVAGTGRGGTWPSHFPRTLGFRIDNAFVNQHLIPRSSIVLCGMGSDHRAIVVGLDFACHSQESDRR